MPSERSARTPCSEDAPPPIDPRVPHLPGPIASGSAALRGPPGYFAPFWRTGSQILAATSRGPKNLESYTKPDKQRKMPGRKHAPESRKQ
jgi:hypothetical protein